MMMMMAMMVQPTVWKKWRIWRIQYSGYGGYGGWGYGIRWWIVLSVLLVRSMYNTLLLLLLGPNRVPIPIPTTRRLTRASAVRTSLQAFVQEPIHQQRDADIIKYPSTFHAYLKLLASQVTQTKFKSRISY